VARANTRSATAPAAADHRTPTPPARPPLPDGSMAGAGAPARGPRAPAGSAAAGHLLHAPGGPQASDQAVPYLGPTGPRADHL